MAKKALESLSEAMYYILLALRGGEKCGTDIAKYIEDRTAGRVKAGPGTLYTILSKFEKEKLIQETEVEGRKRTYRITAKGIIALQDEIERLKLCLKDAESEDLV
ncbi:MAG: PadR family transcriptional regulator [Ruminococcaceae bacterium]|nr:PadR family transcriptional regulator [Oscillospiraceae bacterium]